MARSLATTSKCSSQSHPQYHQNISKPGKARMWGAAPTEKLLPSGLRTSWTRRVTRPTGEIWMTQSALSHRRRVSPDRPMALCSSGDVVLPVHENPMSRAAPDGIDETKSQPSISARLLLTTHIPCLPKPLLSCARKYGVQDRLYTLTTSATALLHYTHKASCLHCVALRLWAGVWAGCGRSCVFFFPFLWEAQ